MVAARCNVAALAKMHRNLQWMVSKPVAERWAKSPPIEGLLKTISFVALLHGSEVAQGLLGEHASECSPGREKSGSRGPAAVAFSVQTP